MLSIIYDNIEIAIMHYYAIVLISKVDGCIGNKYVQEVSKINFLSSVSSVVFFYFSLSFLCQCSTVCNRAVDNDNDNCNDNDNLY